MRRAILKARHLCPNDSELAIALPASPARLRSSTSFVSSLASSHLAWHARLGQARLRYALRALAGKRTLLCGDPMRWHRLVLCGTVSAVWISCRLCLHVRNRSHPAGLGASARRGELGPRNLPGLPTPSVTLGRVPFQRRWSEAWLDMERHRTAWQVRRRRTSLPALRSAARHNRVIEYQLALYVMAQRRSDSIGHVNVMVISHAGCCHAVVWQHYDAAQSVVSVQRGGRLPRTRGSPGRPRLEGQTCCARQLCAKVRTPAAKAGSADLRVDVAMPVPGTPCIGARCPRASAASSPPSSSRARSFAWDRTVEAEAPNPCTRWPGGRARTTGFPSTVCRLRSVQLLAALLVPTEPRTSGRPDQAADGCNAGGAGRLRSRLRRPAPPALCPARAQVRAEGRARGAPPQRVGASDGSAATRARRFAVCPGRLRAQVLEFGASALEYRGSWISRSERDKHNKSNGNGKRGSKAWVRARHPKRHQALARGARV